jgi:hypothetical protein
MTAPKTNPKGKRIRNHSETVDRSPSRLPRRSKIRSSIAQGWNCTDSRGNRAHRIGSLDACDSRLAQFTRDDYEILSKASHRHDHAIRTPIDPSHEPTIVPSKIVQCSRIHCICVYGSTVSRGSNFAGSHAGSVTISSLRPESEASYLVDDGRRTIAIGAL